jgi:NAD+ synthase (glutamine-hydrolysing)
MSLAAHVAAVSINQTVGDWSGNRRRILGALEEARSLGARLVLFPEMCIPGYSLGDRLLMEGTLRRSEELLEDLRPHTAGLVAIVGMPLRHRGVLYNVAVVLADGCIAGIVPKENLATGDVQYESRWFSGWPRTRVGEHILASGQRVPMGGLVFSAPGLGVFAIEICEDGWKGIRPGSAYTLAGAQVICNPSASWFVIGKHRIRRSMVEQISREDHCAYLYSSLMGCDATRLVFDGSLFIASDGNICGEGRRFLFGPEWEVIDQVIDIAALDRARAEEGSWRQQSEQLLDGSLGSIPPTVELPGDYSTPRPPPPREPYWSPRKESSPDPSLQWLSDSGQVPAFGTLDISHLELELALALGLREYTAKCGIEKIALALSGGRDSAMCAIIVGRMVGYDNPGMERTEIHKRVGERFVTAYMGTENSGEATRSAASRLAAELGAQHYEGSIQGAVGSHIDIMEEMTGVRLDWSSPSHDIPLQNVQARLRGSLIWMIANIHQALLLSTSNKSEAAVGYATMDGDTSGGISLIADVPKSLVVEWLEWAARFHGLDAVRHVIATPATAELRPKDRKQTDEEDLMPFYVLDQLMYHFVQLGQEPLAIFRTLWPRLGPRYGGDPVAFASDIRKFVRMLCFAQWKRERFAISFRVASFDLDPKTGFRFPPVQSPFREELAELDAYVVALEEAGSI